MQKEKIEPIFDKCNFNKIKSKTYRSQFINILLQFSKGKIIYPKEDMRNLFREDKDFIYAVLDALEKEGYLKTYNIFRCCKCNREKIINKRLIKNEEIICEKCGADNDDRDCIVGYEVLY